MAKYLFMDKVIDSVSHGKTLNRAVYIILWIFTVLLGLSCLIGWIALWGFVAHIRGAGMLGGIIFQLIFVVMTYMLIHTIIIRARNIKSLPENRFIAIPIISVLLKLSGELYACFAVSIGVGGGVLSLFAGSDVFRSLMSRGSLSTLFTVGSSLGGLFFMVIMVVSAVFAIAYFYFLSEIIFVLIEIADNTRTLRKEQANEIITKEEDPTKCPKCGAKINSDDKFCNECGSLLKDQ